VHPFKMSSLARMLSVKVSPKEIEGLVGRLNIAPSGNLDIVTSDSVGVAAVQLLLKRYESVAEYIVDMNLYIEDAVNRRAQLIVFPAFAGLLPFTFMPQYEAGIEKIRPDPYSGLPDFKSANASLALVAEFVYEVFYYTMSMLAAKHRVYIMAGTSYCYEDEELRHRAFLFADDGQLAGFQDKVSLNTAEQGLSVNEGAEVKAFDTPMGTVAIAIGEDVGYYEVGRIAKSLGAGILLNPTWLRREYTPADAADGLNLRVQENKFYGVRSAAVGDTGLGFPLQGPCAIYAPNEIVRGKNGILEQSSGRYAPDILYRRLNLDKLSEIKSPYTSDKNSAFLDKYVDRLY